MSGSSSFANKTMIEREAVAYVRGSYSFKKSMASVSTVAPFASKSTILDFESSHRFSRIIVLLGKTSLQTYHSAKSSTLKERPKIQEVRSFL